VRVLLARARGVPRAKRSSHILLAPRPPTAGTARPCLHGVLCVCGGVATATSGLALIYSSMNELSSQAQPAHYLKYLEYTWVLRLSIIVCGRAAARPRCLLPPATPVRAAAGHRVTGSPGHRVTDAAIRAFATLGPSLHAGPRGRWTKCAAVGPLRPPRLTGASGRHGPLRHSSDAGMRGRGATRRDERDGEVYV
jgi:hypothetical protein